MLTKKIRYYSDGEIREVIFNKNNFLHLTGVSTNLSAKQFYGQLKNNVINKNDLYLRSDGTTKLKLSVAIHIKDILSKCLICIDYEMNKKLHIEYIIKTKKQILGLGVYDTYPTTLLNCRSNMFYPDIKFNVDTVEINDVSLYTTYKNPYK